MPRFTHLHTHSHYSLLDGLAKIPDLVKHAKELGMDSLALTDHGNVYGAIEFYKAAKKEGVKPILGVEAYIAPGDRKDKTGKEDNKYFHLVLLAENDVGWKNLIKLITRANLEGFYYKPRMDKEILREHHEGLIALSACLGGEVSRYLIDRKDYEGAKKTALEYDAIFGRGNFFLEIQNHAGIPETIPQREGLLKIARETGIPLAATQDIHYLKKEDAEVHDILLAIGTGDLVSKPDRLTLRNDDFSMRSPDEMASLFAELPEAIENTAKIADRCNVSIKLGETQLPKFPLPEGVNANAYMRELVQKRIGERYPEMTQAVKDRMEYELAVVEKMGFADYFLIVQDFINWAKERGIVVGPGRGSAAGSMVSYILGITDVDPIHYDLLFERFLNPDRIQMPDIDVDFTDRRRDEVFGYLQEKYGLDHVAHIITFGTMAARASIRDVGRALGISYGFCDQIAKLIPFNQDLGEALESVEELKKLYTENADAKRIIDIAKKMEGVARHASVHACGTVISKNSLTDYLPLQHAPQDENVVLTQFEMHSVEDLGLLKMDLLGLKNLTIIEDTLRLVLEGRGENVDMRRIPIDDARIFELLQAGDTTGVFQLESSGMRRYLKELKPSSIEDIVAMVALYRPGPMDLIPEYIAVKHGRKAAQYLHPKLEPILGRTYGVGVYQEQMMRIARDLAGFTLAEADTLRKAIGKKIKELLDKQREKLISGMIKNDIPEATATAIWELFPPFARYGFNRCLAGDTLIDNPETGERVTMRDLHGKKAVIKKVVSLDKDLKLAPRHVSRIYYNGQKQAYELVTRSGRKIKATGNHPFLTTDGWKLLEKIKIGEKIATPRSLPEPTRPVKAKKHELVALGYLLSEGNLCHPHGVYFYSTQQNEISDYVAALRQFKNTDFSINTGKPATSIYAKRLNKAEPAELNTWIESLGLKYKKATEKFFPTFVFNLSNKDLAILIGKMFQGDGCVNLSRPDPQIFYATSSYAIATNLQHLLLRFGILSTVHTKKFRYRGGIKVGFTVSVSRYNNIEKFINAFESHLIGEKKNTLHRIKRVHPFFTGQLSPMAARGSYDIVPATLVLPFLRETLSERGTSMPALAQKIGVAERLFYSDTKKIGYLRETLAALTSVIPHDELSALANSDIYWDEITDIKDAGVTDTYDLTVPGNHNFVANDIIVHNSHAVCYAWVGYQTAYLKAHYPVEFMTSLLNSDAGDVERASFLIGEAKKSGIEVLPPDVNNSSANFTPEGKNIRFGLAAVKNVGEAIVAAVIAERESGGPFRNLADLLTRVKHKDLNKKSLESLTKCGALDSFGIPRGTILGNLEDIVKFGSALKKAASSNQSGLFGSAPPNSLRIKPFPETDMKEKLQWEKELLGLYVSDHPLRAHLPKLKALKTTPIPDAFKEKSELNRLFLAGIVTRVQKIVTKKGQPMAFTKIEDMNGSIELIVFPKTLTTTNAIWREGAVILVGGKMSWKDNEPRFIVDNGREL